MNKNFQETASLSIVLSCSFIKLAQNTIVTTTSKLNLTLNASHIHYTHHFLRRCQVQVLDTFRYAANEFYSKIYIDKFTVQRVNEALFFEVTTSRSCKDVNGFHNVTFGPGGKAIIYFCSVFR